ncbi:hypothetical protein Bca101_076082 [Brassica carinata]
MISTYGEREMIPFQMFSLPLRRGLLFTLQILWFFGILKSGLLVEFPSMRLSLGWWPGTDWQLGTGLELGVLRYLRADSFVQGVMSLDNTWSLTVYTVLRSGLTFALAPK